jgi:hypothetical protein
MSGDMTRRQAITLLTACCAARPGRAIELEARRVRARNCVHAFELAAPGEFSIAWVRSRAKHDLKRIEAEEKSLVPLRLIRISYFTNEDDMARTASGKGANPLTFEEWEHRYRRYAAKPYPMADVFQIGDAGALRFRGGRGDQILSEPLPVRGLTKASPLLIDWPRVGAFEILELLFHNDDEDGPADINCYARFTPAAQNIVMERVHAAWLANQLARQLGTPNVVASIRLDTWFIDEPDFPLAYRYTHSPQPSKEAYQKSRTCTARAGEPGR